MSNPGSNRSVLWCGLFLAACLQCTQAAEIHRSPVDLVLTSKWLVSANFSSNTISLVDLVTRQVIHEVPSGSRPTAITKLGDRAVAVVSAHDGMLRLFEVKQGKLVAGRQIFAGGVPAGVATQGTGTAYVTLSGLGKLARFDLATGKKTGLLTVGRWPRSVKLTRDKQTALVACSGDGGVWFVDLKSWSIKRVARIRGLNLGAISFSPDGRHAYYPWTRYRRSVIDRNNVGLGLVLGSRLGRVWLNPPHPSLVKPERITLDPPAAATGDPVACAVAPDGSKIAVSIGGVGSVMVLRLPDLKFGTYGGSNSFLDRRVGFNTERVKHYPVEGRPMGMKVSDDSRYLYVANYLEDRIDRIDLLRRKILPPISLGKPRIESVARKGERIFYDAKRSFERWFSCHSCHFDGGTNSTTMATSNDGSPSLFKTVLPLFNVAETGPFTWHGWQKNLAVSVEKSMRDTLVNEPPPTKDVLAIVAFLKTLKRPPNPYRDADGRLSIAAKRGEAIFKRAGCIQCHAGKYFTDGENHDVGLGSPKDKFPTFNTPSLLGVYQKTHLLHDGRGKDLRHVLTGPHAPARTGASPIRKDELPDLIEFLKSL